MAVSIRLRRMGRKKRPVYAVVATDSRNPRDGRYIEDLGRYYPLRQPAEVILKEDRVTYWLHEGAQPSDTVRSMFSKQGLMLRAHLESQGASEEEIVEAVEAHREQALSKEEIKLTKKDRLQKDLEAEEERLRKEEEERRKAEEEARKKAEEEAARKKAEEEAKAAEEAEAAKKAEAAQEDEEAGEEAAADEADASDGEADESTDETDAEASDEEAEADEKASE